MNAKNAKVIIFGATGMLGSGVLKESLADPRVESVVVVTRRPTGEVHPKLKEVIHKDFLDFRGIENEFKGARACFYCLGVPSAGMSEADYTRMTHDFTVKAAESLHRVSPELAFCFTSGVGADEKLESKLMWARVKGKTENSIRDFNFGRYFVFRPGFIRPVKGVTSNVLLYRTFYTLLAPITPVLARIAPDVIVTTEEFGKAMLQVSLGDRERMNVLKGPADLIGNKEIRKIAEAAGTATAGV